MPAPEHRRHRQPRRNKLGHTLAVAVAASVTLIDQMSFSAEPESARRQPPDIVLTIELDSENGKRRFLESRFTDDYWPLSQHFTAQKNLAYCGVATAVTVLNALTISESAATTSYGPYSYFTQESFFTPAVRQVILPETVTKHGMTLDELTRALKTFPVNVQSHYASDSTQEDFLRQAKSNLSDPTNFLIVNYDRAFLNQRGSGHFSPIAAYDQKDDRFLILDVAPFKYRSAWVSSRALWLAMQSIDPTTQKSRGYIVVEASYHGEERQPITLEPHRRSNR